MLRVKNRLLSISTSGSAWINGTKLKKLWVKKNDKIVINVALKISDIKISGRFVYFKIPC